MIHPQRNLLQQYFFYECPEHSKNHKVNTLYPFNAYTISGKIKIFCHL